MFIQIRNVRINTDHIIEYEIPAESFLTWSPEGHTNNCYYIQIIQQAYPHDDTSMIFCFDTKEERDNALRPLDVACDVKKVD